MATEKQFAFIFYDPSGRRWLRFRRALQTLGLVITVIVLLFGLTMLINPQLPALGLPRVERLPSFSEVPSIIRGERPIKNTPFHMRKAGRQVQYVRSNSPVIHPKPAARAVGSQPIVFGYYVNWDRASIVSLRLHLNHLTHLVPEWLILKNAQGDLDDESDPTVIAIARQANLPIVAMVTNFRDGWQPGDVRRILNDPQLRADLIQNIANNIAEHKFGGVNIDFEQLEAGDRNALVVFMSELRAKLQPRGALVTESVPVDDPSYDLKRLSAVVDYIVPMVYDEHYQSGSPGPVASEQWFENELDKLAKIVPPEKAVIGFGNYGYDWIMGATSSAEVGFGDVMAAASGSKVAISWDAETKNPVLRYTSGGQQHERWFLDAVTALNQVQAVNDAGFRGVGLWRLGSEDPGLWNVLKREAWPEDNYNPVQLFPLTAQASPLWYGDGDIMRVAETPHDGKRNVWVLPDGDYVEQYQQNPSYYVIERSGHAAADEYAITFDDGPDPQYTPHILDILGSKHVPATFFVVGVNAEQNPNLIRREYAEGHLIGNHTYSHPNIATTSDERTKLELMWTQRIIENALGVSTTLFRPPYNADSEPSTPAEILPILRAQNLGYMTVGERIDPQDWRKGITAEAIVNEVQNELNEGHLILLHDAGGDRSQTIAALPRIIDLVRSRGGRFVPINALIGETRAQIMAVPSKEEMRWAHIEGNALDFKSQVKKVVGMLFLMAIYLSLLRSLVYGLLAIIQKVRTRRLHFDLTFKPPVSVIIAAYNEEKVIVSTVESILASDYGELEVVVVDDGSKDGTLKLLHDRFAANSRVSILTQANAGKSAALNHAITQARNEILISVDADTIFQRGTVGKLVRHFADSKIGAVSGNARVGNRRKWITRFQSIEYIYGFNLDRRALDLLNAITVVPGAVGAWRKELILKLDGFGHDTLAEDTDLTLAIRRLGYIIRYEEEGIAYTEAPEDIRSLAKQRFRWAFGTLQAAWKHRDALFVPKYGSLGFVALPSIWMFQVLLSALSPFAELAMLVSLFSGNWPIVLLYYMGFFVLELLTGLLAYALEGEKPWDLTLLFFQRIFYRELMYYVLAKSLLYAMRGRLVGWGKLERRATVEGV